MKLNRFALLLFAILALSTINVTAAKQDEDVALPRAVKSCKRDTPDYTSCLRLAIQESWMTFMRGIPALGLPILDPYVEEYFEHDYQSGEIQGKLTITNLHVYGLAKANILAVRPHLEENRFTLAMDIEIPKSLIEGDYKVEGVVGPYKIGGKGYFNVSLEGMKHTWNMEGRVDNDRWVIEHFIVDQDVDKLKVYVDDLFNGNVPLTQVTIKFFNENWPIFYKGALPYITEYLDMAFTQFANEKVFSKISFAKSFP